MRCLRWDIDRIRKRVAAFEKVVDAARNMRIAAEDMFTGPALDMRRHIYGCEEYMSQDRALHAALAALLSGGS